MLSKCLKPSIANRYVMSKLVLARLRILMLQMLDRKINHKWERLVVSGRRTTRRWFERLIVRAIDEIEWSMGYLSSGSHKATTIKRMSHEIKWYTNYTRTEMLKSTKIVYMLDYTKTRSRLKENIVLHSGLTIIFLKFRVKFLLKDTPLFSDKNWKKNFFVYEL